MRLKSTLVLHGNGTDLDVLTDEDVGAADVFVALTNNDEVNLISGLIAKQLGAKSTFALINAADYLSLVGTLGIDAVLSPRQVTADAILRFVRRGQVLSVATVDVDQAEILELAAGQNAACIGTPLQELKLPRGCIIGALLHNGEVVIPGGTDVIKPSDSVVVFARRESIRDIEKLFS